MNHKNRHMDMNQLAVQYQDLTRTNPVYSPSSIMVYSTTPAENGCGVEETMVNNGVVHKQTAMETILKDMVIMDSVHLHVLQATTVTTDVAGE